MREDTKPIQRINWTDMIKQTQTKINKDDMMEDNKGDKNPLETMTLRDKP